MSGHRLPHDLMMSSYEKADPGTGNAIVVDRWNLMVPFTIVASASETNTLATPTRPGQKLSLVAVSVGGGGSRVVTAASAVNQNGDTAMTFDAVRELVQLESIPIGSSSYRWQIMLNEGSVALS